MSDRDMDERLRTWAHSPVEPEAPEELRRQIFAIPPTETTTPRRRWRWFLPGPKPTAGAEERHDQAWWPASTSANHIGGTRSMFSATKLLAMAASVALFGALTLALPLSQQQDPVTPGAEAPAFGEITSFTGEMEVLGQDRVGSVDGISTTGEQWTTRLTTTDPRFSGLATGFHNLYQADQGPGFVRAHTSRQFTEDADGTWLSTGRGYQDPETTGVTWVTHSAGEGTYEGLSAISICEQADGSTAMECHGIVFEGEWPEFPSEAPTEVHAAYGTP